MSETLPRSLGALAYADAEPPRARPRVLVIDDEPMLARLMQVVLERDGFDVEVVFEGLAAIDRLKVARFDAVICDIHLPGANGLSIYDETNRTSPDLAERFVFTSGGAYGASDPLQTRRLTNPVLSKPFPIKHLRDTISIVARVR